MAFDLSALVESYKAPETFEVKLPAGETFIFRAIQTHAELVKFNNAADQFAKVAGSKKLSHEDWAEFVPVPSETAKKVYTVAELSVEPKLTQKDALELAHKLPFVLETLHAQIDLNRSAIFQRLIKEALEEGKDD